MRFRTGTTKFRAVATTTFVVFAMLASATLLAGEGVAAGASQSPIKIGFLTSLTGPTSPGKGDAIAAAKARVDLINASGGIRGRKIQLVVADDQSSPQGALTGAQSLVSQGVVGIETDNVTFEGAGEQYVDAQKIPIVGLAADAATLADPHVFSPLGSSGPTAPGNTSLGIFFKKHGVSTAAGVSWGDFAAAVSLMASPLAAAAHVGVKTVLKDLTPTPTTTDFTSDALKIQASGAEGVFSAMATPSNVAMASAIYAQKVQLKADVYQATNYEASVLAGPNQAAIDGTFSQYWFAPIQAHTAATQQYVSVLSKYAPHVFGGLIETLAYVSTDLLIQGLLATKGSVTPASLTKGLSSLTSYIGAGLIPQPLNFTLSKTNPKNVEKCFWYPEIMGGKFVISSPKPVCGALVSP